MTAFYYQGLLWEHIFILKRLAYTDRSFPLSNHAKVHFKRLHQINNVPFDPAPMKHRTTVVQSKQLQYVS